MIKKPLLGPKRAKENRKMHWEGSSEHLRKALDLSKVVTRRFQIVAVAVCVAMSRGCSPFRCCRPRNTHRNWKRIRDGIRR